MGIGAAIIASAVIGAGSAYIAGEKAEKEAEADQARREAEAAAAQAEADRIASETKPEEQALGETVFGTGDAGAVGSTSEFLVPKTSALGGTGRSGLGFTI